MWTGTHMGSSNAIKELLHGTMCWLSDLPKCSGECNLPACLQTARRSMKEFTLVSLFLLIASPSFAENTKVLKCRVDNQQWKATFQLDAIGVGLFEFRKVMLVDSR